MIRPVTDVIQNVTDVIPKDANVILNEVKNLIHNKIHNTMKNILTTILSSISVLVPVAFFSGCAQIPEIETELALDRCLTPTNLSRTVYGEEVQFSWSTSKGSTEYVLEVYSDQSDPDNSNVKTETVTAEEIPFTVTGLEPDMTLYARVRGVSETIGDSNWAEFSPVETYAIRPNVSDLKVGTRTSASVQLTWSTAGEDGDDYDVNTIRYALASDPEPDVNYIPVEVSEEEARSGSKTIEGLDPSVKYVFFIHFGNTPRGSISAYTLPDTENATRVENSEALVTALNDHAAEILIAYSDTPYDFGYSVSEGDVTMFSLEDIDYPVVIYGEEKSGEPGVFPTVYGNLSIVEGCTSIVLENIAFDGENYSTEHLLSFKAGITTSLSEVTVRNCTFNGFKRGIAYAGSNPVSIDSFTIDDIVMSNTSGDGGEMMGFRASEGAFGTISITNSTFTGGGREFMRINDADGTITLGTLIITNNTFNSICTFGGAGIFYCCPQPSTFNFSNNIVLNMADASFNSGSSVWGRGGHTPSPTVIAENFFYNIGGNFWDEDVFTEAIATSNGGALLDEDPCAESVTGNFHVMNDDVLAAGSGDPRWIVEGYVKPEEDLTMEVIDPVYTWDFTDGNSFYNTADKNMVRGGIRFYVTSNPVEFDTDNGRLYFTAAGQMGASEPTDCAIGFKVNRPGSVVISTSPSSAYPEAHATISLDGKHVGAVPVDASEFQISLADIVEGEEHTVYIYGCDPFYITYLQWSDYIGGGDSQLPSPEPVISAASAPVTSSDPVTISWEAVPNAGSYDIMNGTELFATVTEPSYEIIPSAVGAGMYSFTVIAKPAADDTIREQSEPSEPVAFEITEVLTAVSAYTPTTWGAADFEYLFNTKAAGSKDTEVTGDFIYNNLQYLHGSGKCKFGEDTNASGVKAYRYQFGGKGSTVKNCLQFIASGNGTLTIEAASSGNSDRYVGVSVGENLIVGETELMVPASKEARIFNVTVTAAAGDVISIYSLESGINVFSITWTPEEQSGSGIPYDENAINEPYMADFSDAATFPKSKFEETRVVEKVSYVGASGKGVDFDPDGGRVKFNGKPSLDDNGLPEYRYASFKVTVPGTVHFLIRSSSNDDSGRNATVALAKEVDGQLQVVELYSDFAKTSGTDPLTVGLTAEHLSGATSAVTLYFFSKDNTVNLYQLGFTPGE